MNRDLYAPLNENKICAFRRGSADVDPPATDPGIQPLPIYHVVQQPWLCHDSYFAAYQWCRDTGLARLDHQYGVTYINGSVYHNRFVFERAEDLLAFRLRFPELG